MQVARGRVQGEGEGDRLRALQVRRRGDARREEGAGRRRVQPLPLGPALRLVLHRHPRDRRRGVHRTRVRPLPRVRQRIETNALNHFHIPFLCSSHTDQTLNVILIGVFRNDFSK